MQNDISILYGVLFAHKNIDALDAVLNNAVTVRLVVVMIVIKSHHVTVGQQSVT